ncbi:DUF2141 domain-containing protein [Sorangium sp. So ce1000]|uniref:DUF2141 domain-containing protein n=1 Tax=Sorangium sp. So ce1000 TaxID=3133325 RepID=UPI003F648693
MKRLAHIVWLAVLAAAGRPAIAAEPSTITVTVGTLRNADGYLGCALYSDKDTFLDTTARTAVRKRIEITGKSVTCTFSNVAPGTYAIAVLHDENKNGKTDTNLLGIPTEGYGVSNNKTHALSRPTWDESKFVVAAGKSVALAISLRY